MYERALWIDDACISEKVPWPGVYAAAGPFGTYQYEWDVLPPALREEREQLQLRREPNNPPGIEYLREGGRS